MVNLPGVGENLQDHPSIFGMTWTLNKAAADSVFRVATPQAILQYLKDRTGKDWSEILFEWLLGGKSRAYKTIEWELTIVVHKYSDSKIILIFFICIIQNILLPVFSATVQPSKTPLA